MFSPITKTDTAAAARALGEELADERATFVWDADKEVAAALAATLDVGDSPIAWDVYLWFDADAAWGDAPPTPRAWAHQLSGASAAHDHAGGLPAVFDAWMTRHATGETATVAPRDPARPTFTFAADQIRPLPEVIVQKVLEDWAAAENADLDESARRAVVEDLLDRMRALRADYASRVPKAVLLDGQVYTLPGEPSCAPPDQDR